MKLSNELGRYIRQARESKGRMQKDVAKQAKVSETFYSEIERGTRFPSYKKLTDVCRILMIPMSAIEPIAQEGLFKRWKGWN